ncbi:MAG: hypothetical protein CK424_00155 [Legionella sp.]|nr:MAG: hypothetical protein CK424_00155 [Legionella sp.]
MHTSNTSYLELARRVAQVIRPYEGNKYFIYHISCIKKTLQSLEKNYDRETHVRLNTWINLFNQFCEHQQLLNLVKKKIQNEGALDITIKEAYTRLYHIIYVYNYNENWEQFCHPSGALDKDSIRSLRFKTLDEALQIRVVTIDKETDCKVLNKSIQDCLDMNQRLSNYAAISMEVQENINQLQSDSPLLNEVVNKLNNVLRSLQTEIRFVNAQKADQLVRSDIQKKCTYLRDKASMMAVRMPAENPPKIAPLPPIKEYVKLVNQEGKAQSEKMVGSLTSEEMASLIESLKKNNPVTDESIQSRIEKFKKILDESKISLHQQPEQFSINALLISLRKPRRTRCLYNILHETVMSEVYLLQEIAEKLTDKNAEAAVKKYIQKICQALNVLYSRIDSNYTHVDGFMNDFINIPSMLNYKESEEQKSLYCILQRKPEVLVDRIPLNAIHNVFSKMNIEEAIQKRFATTTAMHQDMFSSIVIAKRICALVEINDLEQIKTMNPDVVNINLIHDLPISSSQLINFSVLKNLYINRATTFLGRYNALILAVSYRHIEIVRYFLEKGADPRLKGGRLGDHSSLDCAHIHQELLGFKKPSEEIVELLNNHLGITQEYAASTLK